MSTLPSKARRRLLLIQRHAVLCASLGTSSFLHNYAVAQASEDTAPARRATLTAENSEASADSPNEFAPAFSQIARASESSPMHFPEQVAPLTMVEKQRLVWEVDGLRWREGRAKNLWLVTV